MSIKVHISFWKLGSLEMNSEISVTDVIPECCLNPRLLPYDLFSHRSFNVRIHKQDGIYKAQCNTKHIFLHTACLVISLKSSVLCLLQNLFRKNKFTNSLNSTHQCHHIIQAHAIFDVELEINTHTQYIQVFNTKL